VIEVYLMAIFEVSDGLVIELEVYQLAIFEMLVDLEIELEIYLQET
jgi:hypothetical protein